MKFKINEDKTKLIITESNSEEFNQIKRVLCPFVDGYRFMPRFKMGVWNGKIDFFNNGHINLGLWKMVYDICEEYGYKFEVENKELFPKDTKLKKQDVVDFCDEFYKNHRTEDKKTKKGLKVGDPFKPYDHQVDAIYKLLKYKFGLVEIATAGGKSLVLSTIIFYILSNINSDAKFLIIVPNISLVTQLYDDILDYNIGYNQENENPLEINPLEIMSDKPRKVRDGKEPNVYIGTYQSLEKYPFKFFQQFELIATDECHKAKAASITKILNRTMGFSNYRFGVTGTIQKEASANRITIESLMGPNLFTIKAKKLQEKGLISPIKITSLLLNYDDVNFAKNLYAIKKRGGGKQVLTLEKEYIHNSEKRKYFITKLIKKFKTNSLILFHSISYGTELYKFCRDNIPNVDFYYVDGKIKSEKREYIKKQLENTKGNPKIGICSFGTFSTGINVKAINNIVFVDSFKSDQIIRQSIGRGLRLHKDKEILRVYDIVDIFSKKYTNTLYQHYKHRRGIYKEQEFEYEEIGIALPGTAASRKNKIDKLNGNNT
jgi:Kyanoviridae DNA helicase